MGLLLDCQSLDTTLASLGVATGMDPDGLRDALDTAAVVWGGDVREQLLAKLGRPTLLQPERIRWFHATRVLPGTTFAEGLLPTDAALAKLWEAVGDIVRQEDWMGPAAWATYRASFQASDRFFAEQLRRKQSAPGWEGPFGFLVRSAAISGRDSHEDGHKDFTRVSEALEDICADFREVTGHPLLEAFQAVARPCLVWFTTPYDVEGPDVLGAALVYAHRALNGLTPGLEGNTNFCGHGEPIPPGWIERVEWLAAA